LWHPIALPSRTKFLRLKFLDSELLDLYVSVAGVDRQRNTSAIQLSVQFVALSSAGSVVVYRQRQCAVHMAVTAVNIQIGGEVLGDAD
jgi:hypothetical protein